MWEYKEYEAILAGLHDISPEDMSAFGAKLKMLRMAGVPKIATAGKGKRLQYAHYDLWETHLALAFVEIGLPPVKITSFMEEARRIKLFKTVKNSSYEMHMVIYTYLNAGKAADHSDVVFRCDVMHIDSLIDTLKNSKDSQFKLVINLSQLTRETEV